MNFIKDFYKYFHQLFSSSKINTFLLFSSGANIQLLEKPDCQTERNKYRSTGAIILSTAVVASLSGGYALFTVFGSLLSIPLGVFWGIIVFNLDRFFASSIKKTQGDNLLNNVYKTIGLLACTSPRLLIALLLGIAISVPVEIKLFERIIVPSIVEKRKEKLENELVKTDKYLADFATEKIKNNFANSKTFDDIVKNIEQKRDRINKDLKNVDSYKPSFLESFNELEKISNYKVSNNGKKLNNEKQLNNDEQINTETILISKWFIRAIFIILDTSPILVKLLLPYGPYDARLEEEERKITDENVYPSLKRIERIKEEKKLELMKYKKEVEYIEFSLSKEIKNKKEIEKLRYSTEQRARSYINRLTKRRFIDPEKMKDNYTNREFTTLIQAFLDNMSKIFLKNP